MKDIMQKLSELEATAPKVSKKKMLKEDSTTPPMNVSDKPASLKDVFESIAGQKPIPVVGKEGGQQSTAAGFVNVTDPALQGLGKTIGDLAAQKKIQLVVPTQPGQAPQAGTTPAPAGATGQPQAGQQPMREKDEGKPGKNFAKIAKSAAKRYGSKEAGERVAGAVRAKLAKQGKLEEEQLGEILNVKLSKRDPSKETKWNREGWPLIKQPSAEAHLGAAQYHDEQANKWKAQFRDALKNPNLPEKGKEAYKWEIQRNNQEAKKHRLAAKNFNAVNEAQLDEKFASKQQAKLMYATAGGADTGVSKKVAKEFIKKSHGQKVSKLPKKKTDEADIPSTNGIDTMGAGLGAGRSMTTLEGKKPDFLDLDKDGNKKESMKKAAADKKKKKVDESMNHRINAARLEGKSHGLRGHAHSGKRYEDLEELKAYHEGYKEGLDECYGMGVYEGIAGTAGGAIAGGMIGGPLGALAGGLLGAEASKGGTSMFDETSPATPPATVSGMADAAMDEGNAFTAALAKTPKGGKFSVGGKTFTDRSSHDAKIDEYAFEAWDRELSNLLNECTEVNEGLSVSVSKGQQNSPDSVTITAQDAEADQLLQLVKHAGLGLFGDEAAHEPSSAMSLQPTSGEPDEVGAGGVDIDVVDGSDGMLSLMKKLGGVEAAGAEDYADEEGDSDCGCEEETNEETCNECGGMMEAGHSCGGKEMVDEVESEDQMEFEVAEDNAPDSETSEHNADEEAEAQEDAALAQAAQQNKTNTVNEGGDGGEASEEGEEDKEGETDEEGETVSESFFDLLKKFDRLSEAKEDTEEEDEKAEKAGKKVTKDIEYDDKKDKKEKVDEWANQVGKGPGKGTDASFEQDIDFMTKVIAGGLNKPKSTGQTTIPVIAGQEDRMHDNPQDWATLAGIKK